LSRIYALYLGPTAPNKAWPVARGFALKKMPLAFFYRKDSLLNFKVNLNNELENILLE